jgi:hypothetical protein
VSPGDAASASSSAILLSEDDEEGLLGSCMGLGLLTGADDLAAPAELFDWDPLAHL